jgi:uncharacterized protein (DUF58 family)
VNQPLPPASELSSLATRSQALADIFKLPLQHRVWRGQAGDFQGAGVGSSLDFQDHRSYVPGDDPRHINWQAYARTGSYSMKLYREEVRPLIDLIFDVSDSMFFDPQKRQRCIELFYFAVHSALKSGASLKAHLVRGDAFLPLSDDAIHGHAWASEAENLPDTHAAAPCDLRPIPLRAQSMRIFLSDLLFTGSPESNLMALGRANGRGIILAPFLDSEARPEWEGNYEFVEAESLERLPHRVDRRVMKRYDTAYRRHFDLWTGMSRKYDILVARVPAEPELQNSLQYEALSSGALEIWT